jgi:ABC-type Zn uptake system ZnuABC Zn-binding protein ZnuA
MKRALLLVVAVFVAGCGSGSGDSGGRPVVVATTTQIGDFARQVGGADVVVHQILKPNTDPHDYEPRPADVTQTASAKVVFENGDNLDRWMGDIVKQSGGSPDVVDLGAGVPVKRAGETAGAEASKYDPHWWHDPRNARAAVAEIRDALVKADPGHAATFERNAARYIDQIDALDAGIRKCFDAIPAGERKLVTDHDAFGYFAERYGITVIGAVIPSQTTQAQPSAGDTAKLAAVVRREKVKAIFPESSLNPKLAEALARETGATADHTLYGDTLGPKDSNGATYLTMEQANADVMVRGFSGGAKGCPL